MAKLTGKQYEALTKALLEAFDTVQRLRRMLRFKLDKNLDAVALGGDQTEIVFKVIGAAEAEGWTGRLVAAARESNPGNASLLLVAQELGLAPEAPAGHQLEALIKRASALLDVAVWRSRLGELEGRVCRVEVGGTEAAYGTGFLLGPSVVLTNHHVVASVIERRSVPSDIVLRFDYKRLFDGTTINPGTEYRLAEDWLVDSSPHSTVDLEMDPKSRTARVDELDYALLRVDGSPGHDPVGGTGDLLEASKRGWIEASSPPAELVPHTPLLILQHPAAAPMKLGIDQVTALNENGTRVRYTTPTLPGSSGAPCFDAAFRLVALHHAGEPRFRAAYNEGIPITAILSLLAERGKCGLIGPQPE